MHQVERRSAVTRLKAQAARIQDRIKSVQDACPHPAGRVQYSYQANTGNWDRGDDCYWTNIFCGLCEKRWTVDGSPHVDGERVDKC